MNSKGIPIIGEQNRALNDSKLRAASPLPPLPRKVVVDFIFEMADNIAQQDGKNVQTVLRALADVYEELQKGRDEDAEQSGDSGMGEADTEGGATEA